jgi:hypothetical protein
LKKPYDRIDKLAAPPAIQPKVATYAITSTLEGFREKGYEFKSHTCSSFRNSNADRPSSRARDRIDAEAARNGILVASGIFSRPVLGARLFFMAPAGLP